MSTLPDPNQLPQGELILRCVPVYRAVAEDCGLQAAYIYGVLAVIAGPHGAAITLPALGAECGVSARTVIRNLQKLKAKGWLEDWRPVGGSVNHYKLRTFPR